MHGSSEAQRKLTKGWPPPGARCHGGEPYRTAPPSAPAAHCAGAGLVWHPAAAGRHRAGRLQPAGGSPVLLLRRVDWADGAQGVTDPPAAWLARWARVAPAGRRRNSAAVQCCWFSGCTAEFNREAVGFTETRCVLRPPFIELSRHCTTQPSLPPSFAHALLHQLRTLAR